MAIQKNFNVVGNPTITEEGIASNFSDTSYLTFTSPFVSNMTSFEIVAKFNSTDLTISNAGIYDTDVTKAQRTIRFTITSDGKLRFRCGSDNSSNTYYLDLTGSTTLNTNTDYWAKAIYNSATGYRLQLSTDGIDYTDEATSTITTLFPIPASGSQVLIGDNAATGASFIGKIYLPECYIKINNEEVWNAWKDVGVIPGSVTVGQGYYNADGTNIIKFTSPITKTLTEAAVDLSHKNDIVLTLDSEGTSSFVLNGSDKTLTGYKKTRKLDSPSVYVDPSKQYILGTEPTGINASVDSYSAEANGSVSLTKGWIYSDGLAYQNKNTDPLSVSTLTGNAAGTVGYKNKLQLGYESSSDVSVPSISESLTEYAYDMNTDIYLDNTKSKILGTTALSDSWKDSPYTIQKGIPAGYKQYKIVGNGTTIENGIASGFSESSYIQFIESPFTSTDPDSFKMFFEVTTGDATHSYQEVIAQDNCILLRKSDTTSWNVAVYNGSSWDTTHFGTYAYNTKYYIRVIYFKNTTTWNGYSYTGGYTYAEVSTDNSSWTRTYRTNKPNFASTEPIYLGTNGSTEWWSGSINLNNSRIEFNDEVTFPLNPTSGSVTVDKGYRYIDETNGSFLIESDTTKTLEQLVVGDKTEQMGLYLVIKTDLSTDFVLSSTTPTTDISYAEKVVDVYLDRTLSYIYGTTADPRVKFTINATPNTATVNMVDLVPSSPVQVSSIGTATILVDPSNNLINYGVSAEGYTTKSGTVTATADDTLDVVLEAEAPAERTEPTLPTDTFYAWINQDNPSGNNWFTLTESPIGEDYLYVSEATANNNYPLGVGSSTGVADQTLNATSIQATIQDGNLVFGTTGTVYTRTPSSDGEYTLFHRWVDDTLYNTYLALKTIPVDGDVVYGYNTVTGELTNAGTIGNQWKYVHGPGSLNHVSGAPIGEGMVEPSTPIWIRSTTIPS